MRLTLEEIQMNRSYKTEFCHLLDFVRQEQKELIEYKTIEEELGIDLITLFKALKNDCIYMKDNYPDRIVKCSVTGITKDSLLVLEEGDYYFEDNTRIEYKDYGKTWALTKEELE